MADTFFDLEQLVIGSADDLVTSMKPTKVACSSLTETGVGPGWSTAGLLAAEPTRDLDLSLNVVSLLARETAVSGAPSTVDWFDIPRLSRTSRAIEPSLDRYGDAPAGPLTLGNLGFEDVPGISDDETPFPQRFRGAMGLHFDELYESPNLGPRAVLHDVVADVLGEFGNPAVSQEAWLRLGWMTRALLMAALPTLCEHARLAREKGLGGDLATCASWGASVLTSLESWLDSEDSAVRGPVLESLVVAPQAANDAFDVVVNASSILRTRANALNAAKEIMDDVLEGYAIIPGSLDRRAVFDWWLGEVVPAAWNLQLPSKLWTVLGVRRIPSRGSRLELR